MSAEHDRWRDEVAAYALGALPDLEAQAVERHLMRCESCARELERLRSVVDVLPAAVSEHRAPPKLKDAVMSEVRRSAGSVPAGRSPRRLRWMPRRGLALAGGLAAAAIAAGAYGLGAGAGGERTVAAVIDQGRLADARGTLIADGEIGVLRAAGLPPLDGGRVYVVWVDRGSGPVYASSFNARPDGSAQAGVSSLEGVRRVMVTRERSTAVRQPSERPVLTIRL